MSQPISPSLHWDVPVSQQPGIQWPALTRGRPAEVAALLYQMERSQWWSRETLQYFQSRQLSVLLRHAMRNVPYYAEAYAGAGLAAGQQLSWKEWTALPHLARATLQAAEDRIHALRYPKGHGRAVELGSSGSTGRPVKVRKTALCNIYYRSLTLRDHIWHRRNPAGKLAAIRWSPGTSQKGESGKGWGSSVSGLYRTGPSAKMHSAGRLDVQADWLEREQPTYLLTYPSIAEGLARLFIERGRSLTGMHQVRTFGEALGPDVREMCRKAWNAPVTDAYSAQEIGYMALQCPDNEHYHVVSEAVFLEVVRDDGTPCAAGEIGRVLVTQLHNFATPLIRYEVGDYAEVGEPCSCGRGLPVLKRILGRTRNLARLPGGRRFRPSVGIDDYKTVAPVLQAQLVQHTLHELEARLVVSRALNPDEERNLVAFINKSFGHPFQVRLTIMSELPRGKTWKFEDFMCMVPEP